MKMKELKLYNSDPNVTIVLPIGCNAHCSFCFWHKVEWKGDYTDRLETNLNNLDSKFRKCTITGGEPTLVPIEIFKIVLKIARKRFDKVGLNTNGYNLMEFLKDDYIRNNLDYINVSRHAINDNENCSIFNTHLVPNTLELMAINKLYPVRLNCIFEDDLDYNSWIDYANKVNATGVTFRRLAEKGVKTSSILESRLDSDKNIALIGKSHCDVCYSANYKQGNTVVALRYSEDEPGEGMEKDFVFELVTDGQGNLHTAWDNKEENMIDSKTPFVYSKESTLLIY